MGKMGRFLKLDYEAMKGDLSGRKQLLVFGLLAVAIYFVQGSLGLGMVFIPLASTLVFSPFAAGKDGLDPLYIVLSISRRTVVAGRYISVLLATLISSLALFAIGSTASLIRSDDLSIPSLGLMAIVLFFYNATTYGLMLPALFKLGFKKARFFTVLVPLAGLFLLLFLSHANYATEGEHNEIETLNYFTENLFQGGLATSDVVGFLLVFGGWLLFMLASFVLALKFYKKRQF